MKILKTKRACCLETDTGAEVVVHMGMETVALTGQGFERLVEGGIRTRQRILC